MSLLMKVNTWRSQAAQDAWKPEIGDWVRYNGGLWQIRALLQDGRLMIVGVGQKVAKVRMEEVKSAYHHSNDSSTQDAFESLGKVNEAESKELNRLYDIWAKEDMKLEGSASARRALTNYESFKYKLTSKGRLIRFGGVGKGIIVIEPNGKGNDSAAQDAAQFKIGDKVFFRSHKDVIGEVIKIFGDGTYQVKWNGIPLSKSTTGYPERDLTKAADSAAQDKDFEAKYRVGQKGYKIESATNKPEEIKGEKVVCEIKEVLNKGLNFAKEARYWCRGYLEKSKEAVGQFPVDESSFKPL